MLLAIGALVGVVTLVLTSLPRNAPRAQLPPISRAQAEGILLGSLAEFAIVSDAVDDPKHRLTKTLYKKLTAVVKSQIPTVQPWMLAGEAEYGDQPHRAVFRLLRFDDQLAEAFPITYRKCLFTTSSELAPQTELAAITCDWPKGYDPLTDPLLAAYRTDWPEPANPRDDQLDQVAFVIRWTDYYRGVQAELPEAASLEKFDLDTELSKLGLGPFAGDDSGR